MKTLIALSLFISLSSFAQDVFDLSSCKTQAFLAKQSDKALFGLSVEEVAALRDGRKEVARAGGCTLNVYHAWNHQLHADGYVFVFSNGVKLMDSGRLRWRYQNEDDSDKQKTAIKKAMSTYREALSNCGCTKLH